jgi:Matrixin
VRGDSTGQRTPSGVPTSPTGRIPQWVLDEATGRTPQSTQWRVWEPPVPPARSRRRRARLRAILAASIVVLAVTGAVAGRGGLFGDRADLAVAGGRPTPGVEAGDAPLGSPPAAPAPGGTHRFVAQQADGVEPVAYDPCRPVHYVIRPDNAPAGGEALVHDGFERLSAVTGLQFLFDGATDEHSSHGSRAPFQPDRYGDRWAPVLVAWRTVAEVPEFETDVAGSAGSAAASPPGGPGVFVSGIVDLDAAAFDDLLGHETGRPVARAIVLHELGHLVGLGHVADPTQLMYPTTSTVLDFAEGDLTGLAALGRGACVPEL